MKAPISLLTVLVLSVFSLACSLTGPIVEARSGRAAQTRAVPAVASNLSAPVRPEWKLGSPLKHQNLTVFPVLADQPTTQADLITLDEGLRLGKVTITELGADGRPQTIGRRQMSERAEVNRLALTNTSGKPLVLIAGEMIIGGKQDRIVGHDCIIESSNTPVPLDVFCVEHGRWSGGAAFGESRPSAGDGNANTDEAIKLSAPLALPNIREKAQATKSQERVWGAVAETVTVVGADSSTGTLNRAYQDKGINTKLDGYERALRSKLSDANVVGVVAAISGKIVSADVFASHSLFQAYWPKMLKSYALEAVSATQSEAQTANRSDAEAFLSRVRGANDADARGGIYRLKENQSTSDASFELEYTAKTPSLVHFNRVTKK